MTRQLICRFVGACIAQAMAESDTGFVLMAARLQCRPSSLRRYVARLLNGQSVRLSVISDMLCACDAELEFKPVKREQ